MKIAIDFDDVMVDTMREFERLYNSEVTSDEPLCVYEHVTGWGLARQLGCSEQVVKGIFDRIDYDDVEAVPGAVDAVRQLDFDHEISFLTSNQRTNDVRAKLNDLGFRHLPLYISGNKAGFLRDGRYDVLVDDRVSYLKGAHTVGVKPIRFVRPWNTSMNGRDLYSAQTWAEVLEHVDFIDTLKKVKRDMDAMFGYKDIAVSVPTAQLFRLQDNGDEVVVNEKGAKQSKISGDFTLLPPLAIKEVAKVLQEGAEKYGVDNWKGLSIDEINNHVYNHLLDYQQEANTEDLSHAACRILMALQLHIEALNKTKALRI